jgi:transcriptional regulator with XRE-family HTH domain
MGAVERGESNVSLDSMSAIARALGVELYHLFMTEPDEVQPEEEPLRVELARLREQMRQLRDDTATESRALEMRFNILLRMLDHLDAAPDSPSATE